jgi:biopolymer transport protein ExbD
MTAFLSIQAALLALYMVNTTPDLPVRISVDQARVAHPLTMQDADRDDATVVAVRRDGQFFLGGDAVAPKELSAKIRESMRRGGEHKVYINADRRARYEDVREVLAAVQATGVERIAFLTADNRRY